jgi:4-diphosphocytidyl-2-C-methyl-D-erythritol kinase
VDRAPAKVNLTLQVLGRRPDGYHDIESVVAFADLADDLSYDPRGPLELIVQGPNAQDCGANADNLVLKAARRFADATGLAVAGRFTLTKQLPAAAGLGGGSADAAAALRLLARVHGLKGDDVRLQAAARQVGADVPVCLEPRPRIMRGTGEILSAPLALPPLDAVLVNPRVAVPTREVFAELGAGPGQERGRLTPDQVPGERSALLAFLARRANDLEAPAVRLQPVIADLLARLRDTGARLARMSGSGATCFAIYDSAGQAQAAAHALGASQPEWWVRPTALG